MRTLPFWAIVTMSVLGAWSMVLQSRRIWHAKSVVPLAIPFGWFNSAFYFIVLIYGLDQGLWAMTLNGVLRSATFLPVTIGMMRFHRHSPLERAIAFFFMGLLAVSLVLPSKEVFFLVISLTGSALFTLQPYRIIRTGRTGVLEIRVYVVALLNTSFYTWYGFVMDDAFIAYSALLFAVIITFTIALFWVYPERNEKAAA